MHCKDLITFKKLDSTHRYFNENILTVLLVTPGKFLYKNENIIF